MDVLRYLPPEIKNKVFLYLSHPTADMIHDRVEELGLDKTLLILLENPSFEIDLDFREFLREEHFVALMHFKEHRSYDDYEFLDAVRIMEGLTGETGEV